MTRTCPGARPGLWRSVVEALAVGAAAGALALAVNGMRSNGLPVVASTPYQVMVPCPEPGGPVEVMPPADARMASERTFLVDARSPGEYAAGHLGGAVNLPYDWLDPVPEEHLRTLAREIAASRAVRVVVYGDGQRPDSGEYLGREISGRGIKNVFFVPGGAAAVLGAFGR